MDDRYEEMYAVAKAHFLDGATMDAIARDRGVSRSTVSRLLAKAREQGIVRISMAEHRGSESTTAKELSDAFGVRVHIAVVPEGATPGFRFAAAAGKAAELLNSLMFDGARLGIAWGVTVAQVARQVTPLPLRGVRVVQLNGSANAQESGPPYVGSILNAFAEAYGGRVVAFPLPAFFDHAEAKHALWRERSVQQVLAEIRELDIALFGVGCLYGRVPSHVYSSGYLDAEDLVAVKAQGAVGDVCTVLLREDGTHEDIALNERASGPPPSELKRIPRRLCVVGDPTRARALVGALRAGTVTDLVVDDATGRAVVRYL